MKWRTPARTTAWSSTTRILIIGITTSNQIGIEVEGARCSKQASQQEFKACLAILLSNDCSRFTKYQTFFLPCIRIEEEAISI
jgi:hypothetical protein